MFSSKEEFENAVMEVLTDRLIVELDITKQAHKPDIKRLTVTLLDLYGEESARVVDSASLDTNSLY